MMNQNKYGFDYTMLRTYSGFFCDPKQLLASASGGAATLLSEKMIQMGGKVVGVSYSPDFMRAEFLLCETIADLNQLKGSKYIVSAKEMRIGEAYVPVFQGVGELLKSGAKILFIGLGCDVAALKKYVSSRKIDDRDLYTIDLICHGPTLPEVHRQFVESLENKHHSKLISFNVRNKKRGWFPPTMRAEFKNGAVFECPLYDTDYGTAFAVFSKESCYSCQFRGANHPSDITVGDYWGLTEGMDGYNKNGVSVLFSRTEKGERMIDRIQNDISFDLRPADTAHVMDGNPMFYSCRAKMPGYEKFKKNFETKGLHYAVVHKDSLSQRLEKRIPIRRAVKKLLASIAKH